MLFRRAVFEYFQVSTGNNKWFKGSVTTSLIFLKTSVQESPEILEEHNKKALL